MSARPKLCACGGRLVYTRQGSRLFVYCETCTPVAAPVSRKAGEP